MGLFFAEIIKAEGYLTRCDEEIGKIGEIPDIVLGDENTEGSLAYLQKKTNELWNDYNEQKAIIKKKSMYSYVFPFGSIAASTVASVYGSMATNLLNEYEKPRRNIWRQMKSIGL